ncbi:putative toxin-antitoxin system toxin component, PIN family [Occallatibacter riparius]|uniref:Toxin-antitoxin system toxin component, PIN family n=1 Tax=Occallatibacter riparius TaxID=1002689 RepID=A0A9J7BIX3_9BACT|nr:putative toxin-antitoxin system toxin component, PIN family [Occallatibacter riparius]UWZ82631.1 putative toxin-antitoxin system toxin component, PIN family [Occallatibacter riparius]
MLALRLVVDTNVVVSAALKPDGLERTAFLIAITKPARFYVSEPILKEYGDVMARPWLGIRRGARLQLLDTIRNRAIMIAPRIHLAVSNDPGDNKFVECADAARADYLITGNRRHFPQYWKSTKVITAREFLELASPHLLP